MKNYILAVALITTSLAAPQEMDLGKIHNAVLTEFYNTHTGSISDLVTVNRQLFAINQLLYPQHFSNVSDADVEQFTRALYGTTQLTMFAYKPRAIERINQAVVNGIYSKELAAMYQTFIERSPKKKMVLAILKDFTSHPRSEQDLKSVALFKSAYLASDRYWPNETPKTRARCNPNLQVRIADGTGALFGSIVGSSLPGIGPAMGTAVGGQGMSIFVAALQENNGGRCIY